MEKTAVEWFFNELQRMQYFIGNDMLEAYKQAKEMEKQKLEQFYNHGQWAIIEHGHGDTFEDYYNQTFKQD